MYFPQRKVARFLYETPYGSLYLEFPEATIAESDIFFQYLDQFKDSAKRFVDFVEQFGVFRYKWTRRNLILWKRKQNVLVALSSDLINIVNELLEKRYRMGKSLYDGIDMSAASSEKMLEGLDHLYVCATFGIPGPIALIENYTYTQLAYMRDRVQFDQLNKNPKLKYLNTTMLAKTQANNDEDKELLDFIKSQKK